MDFEGNLNGQLNSNSLKSYLPSNIKYATKVSGNLPMMATIKSDGKVTDINAQVGANSQHYFSPIEINEMKYKTSLFNFDGKLAGNDFLINDVGLYSINPNATLSGDFRKNISNSSKKSPKISSDDLFSI